MTIAEVLRAYVSAHPGATGEQIAAGVHMDKRMVQGRLSNLVHHQILRVDGNHPRGYSIRRELIRIKGRTPEQIRERKAAYHREYDQRRCAARNTSKTITASTVEEYMAQGGHIDRLPGFRYVLPQQLPLGEVA